MIGRIEGILAEKQAPPLILLNVQGICYEVNVPMTTFYDLPDAGAAVALSTHFVVREDAQQLYGFTRRFDRDLFRTLIKVSGIGPKVALAILSGMTAPDVVACIRDGNKAALVKLPGIGAKTAERLIMETRDRLKTVLPEGDGAVSGQVPSVDTVADPVTEAEAALEALGYKKAEAARAVAKADNAPTGALTVEDLIRAALRNLL